MSFVRSGLTLLSTQIALPCPFSHMPTTQQLTLLYFRFHGSQAEREDIKEHLRQYLGPKNSRRGTLDVILSPVSYFQKEKSPDRSFLNKFEFDYLVVDEAHLLRNSQSFRYKELNKVRTRHRLLLTGTPVQNSPQELMNMLCFLMPLFSRGASKHWEEDSANVSIGDRMLQHFVDEKKGSEGDAYAYKKLKHLFAPFVLRRKKDDVLRQLIPTKERVVEFVELDQRARTTYDSILAAHINKSGNKLTGAIGDHLFTNLRKAAHHPLLLRTHHNSPAEIDHLVNSFHQFGAFKGEGATRARVAEEVAKYNDFTIHLIALELIDENPIRRKELGRYILDEEALFCSAKFTRLRTLIPKLISDDHRILIFSVWTSCLDLLGCLVEHLGLQYLRMDGSCPSADRQELIDKFNNNPSYSVFLLSTNACGIGKIGYCLCFWVGRLLNG
jgi:SWI/SNF-related matrix-associated actin-dependent regulator of chromatin subfamily A containing DEAD/H box 1